MIGIKEVEHIASLAKLALTEEEKALYAGQLAQVIEYFDQLQAIDTTGIEPMAHALSMTNVLREDTVLPPGKTLLGVAPEVEGDFFKVPKIGE